MLNIIYTKHAAEKFHIRESKKFKITKTKIKKALNESLSIEKLSSGVIRITKGLDKNHYFFPSGERKI